MSIILLLNTLAALQRLSNAKNKVRAGYQEVGTAAFGGTGGAIGAGGALMLTGASGPVGWVTAIVGGLIGGGLGSAAGNEFGAALYEASTTTPPDVWEDVWMGAGCAFD